MGISKKLSAAILATAFSGLIAGCSGSPTSEQALGGEVGGLWAGELVSHVNGRVTGISVQISQGTIANPAPVSEFDDHAHHITLSGTMTVDANLGGCLQGGILEGVQFWYGASFDDEVKAANGLIHFEAGNLFFAGRQHAGSISGEWHVTGTYNNCRLEGGYFRID